MKNYLKIICPAPAVLERKTDNLEDTLERETPPNSLHQKSVEAYVRDYLAVERKQSFSASKS
jgi:hypothetical protein